MRAASAGSSPGVPGNAPRATGAIGAPTPPAASAGASAVAAPGAAPTPAPKAAPAPSPVTAPGGLATRKAPPFRLPGEHFAAALLFLCLGAAGIGLTAPELAAGAFLSPRVAGVTHLFTLGWITTSIMGALYQFLPVATGEPIRSVRLAHASFALYLPGLLAFVLGLVSARSQVMLAGAATFGTALLLFIGNLAATLRASRARDVTWWALAGAALFLVVTVGFGVALAGNLRWGYLGAERMLALGVHLHVALAGWVLMVMIGVAHRLLPMFLLSHGAGDRFAKAAVALVASGVGILTLLHHASPLLGRWIPAALITAGCAAFLMQARGFYLHRHRRTLDPGMRLAAGGLSVLALGLALAWPVLLGAGGARLATAYIATLLLAITLFVVAHYYKIVPFLVWYHRWGPLAGKRPVPRVNELYSPRVASLAGAALLLGAAGILLSLLLGTPMALRGGAGLFGAGVLLLTMQMISLARNAP